MTAEIERPRQSLFAKYLLALFLAVSIPLIANGASEAWFGYRDQRQMMDQQLKLEAAAAAVQIQNFLDSITSQMGWVVQLPWTPGNSEAHRLDTLRLLRQVEGITELVLVDGADRERVHVSRIGGDRLDTMTDRSADPAVTGLAGRRVWYGPVTLNRGSEPFLRLAVAGNRPSLGIAIAEVNLTFVWDVISQIDVGRTGLAFVVDANTRLVAHPDIGVMLRGIDEANDNRLRALRDAILASKGEPVMGIDFEGREVIAAAAAIPGVDWLVFAELPANEAYAPVFAATWRTLLLMLAGAILALLLAWWLARRMTEPIRLLGEGAARIGDGDFAHRIDIATGDELGDLAARFNAMAGDLSLSRERSERIARLRRFLSPQVADIVEHSGNDSLLEARHADVLVIFGDLRGFTEFSARVEPEAIMRVLTSYYEAVGRIVTRHDATLTHFSGDGVMVLLNAPVACPDDPAARGLRMAEEMQEALQALIVEWRENGTALGFGIGIAAGEATVGRVGYEGRNDYTAVGRVVNLASRLCSSAENGQILIDTTAAAAIGEVKLIDLGPRELKGFPMAQSVFAVRS